MVLLNYGLGLLLVTSTLLNISWNLINISKFVINRTKFRWVSGICVVANEF